MQAIHDSMISKPLPKVCASGEECRVNVFKIAKEEVKTIWNDSVIDIDSLIKRGVQRTEWMYRESMWRAEECDSGCKSTGTCPEDANDRHIVLHTREQAHADKIAKLVTEYEVLLKR